MWKDIPISDAGLIRHEMTASPLSEVVFGLRWQRPTPANGEIARASDLDASCMLLNERNDLIEIVHPARQRNVNGSVVHTGDCKTGGGSWDNERIHVFLRALPEDISKVLFVVTSINGELFEEIGTACCHVTNTVTDELLCGCDLTRPSRRNADVVARLRRVDGDWKLQTPLTKY
jgi:tellurium resistance protein TerZ